MYRLPFLRSIGRAWPSLLLLSAAVLSVSAVFPGNVAPSSTSPERFSGERAMAHLPVIASEPHPTGSAAQRRVTDYLLAQLAASGLESEVQEVGAFENVVARLPGTASTGAILILAHYDSAVRSPGAGDNASGVSALLEVMRALTTGPRPRNDVIVLFDDGEEEPYIYGGARAFVREHSWMDDVRVAISLDTAVAGTISTNEAGPSNGKLVGALARAHTGGAWTSFSGGGQYDTTPFREAGALVLALEDNYPFKEKHTAADLPEVVRAGSVQQMGEQSLAIVRELGSMDLADPWGEHETFFFLPLVGLPHYPESWSPALSIMAGILLVVAIGVAFWRRVASVRGLGLALLTIVVSIALSALLVGALWPMFPDLLQWDTSSWPDWPEVIPPGAGLLDAVLALLVLGVALAGYRLAGRWSGRADFSLAGLIPFVLPAVALAMETPRAAYAFIWPVLLGSLVWIAAVMVGPGMSPLRMDLATALAALPLVVLLLPFLPGVVMADGMKSLAILAGVEALLLAVILPAADALIGRRREPSEPQRG